MRKYLTWVLKIRERNINVEIVRYLTEKEKDCHGHFNWYKALPPWLRQKTNIAAFSPYLNANAELILHVQEIPVLCVCMCVYIHMHSMCVCLHVCMCVCMHICIHTHKYPNVPLQSLRTYRWWNSKDAAVMGLNLTWDQMAPVGEQSSESHAGCPRKSRISGNKKYVHCTVCMRARVCACAFVRACM